MGNRIRTSLVLCIAAILLRCDAEPRAFRGAEASLRVYRAELESLRRFCGGVREMPDVHFYLFGMGARQKLIYKQGVLADAMTGAILRKWRVRREWILPHQYRVVLKDYAGVVTELREDSLGVWVESKGQSVIVPGTDARVRLPDFSGKPFANILRVLHQEMLVNIVDGQPLPNFLIYPKPWYRDGAMVAMCLERTGNLDLIRGWILGLTEPFDHNNAGESEADNPGEALYLLSLVSDRHHPLVAKLVQALRGFEVSGGYIRGRSDFSQHPVYQTKWAMRGLAALGLEVSYRVPDLEDSYGGLFWMRREGGENSPVSSGDRTLYPYLDWASDHFFGTRTGKISDRDYPLTWEIDASQARYEGMRRVDPVYSEGRIGTPHTWHAAEIFLLLSDLDEHP